MSKKQPTAELGYLYKVDGTIEEIRPLDGKYFHLEEMQKAVDGYIQWVPFGDGTGIMCNEEGKLHGLPFNAEATLLWMRYYGPTDKLVGDVLHLHDDSLQKDDEESDERDDGREQSA